MKINPVKLAVTFFICLSSALFLSFIYIALKLNIHALSWILASIFNLFTALFVYLKEPQNRINKTFALFALCIMGWTFSISGLYLVPTAELAKYWSKTFIGLIFIPPTGFHFFVALSRHIDKRIKKLIYLSYIFAAFFFILNCSGLFVRTFIKIGWKFVPKPTIIYTLFVINLIFWISYGLGHVIKVYKNTESLLIKNQLKFFIIGIGSTLIFGLTNFLLSLKIKLYPLEGFASIICMGMIAFAIIKYKALNIEIIIRKSAVYASLTVSIIAIYALLVGIFQGLFGFTRVAHNSLWVNAIAAMIIAASFSPLRNRIQLLVDKLFFKEKYNYQKTLKEFSGALGSIMELDMLMDLILTKVTETMHIQEGSIMLWDEEKEEYRIQVSRGLSDEESRRVSFKENTYLPTWLRERGPFISEEIKFELGKGGSTQTDQRPEIDEVLKKLRELKAVLCIPLLCKGRLIGIFNLGTKLSEEWYSPEDMELLTIIANQAAIAIENARLYRERREMEQNIHRADKFSALGVLASSIAHEIKNPLVSIKTFTQLLPRRFDNPEFRKKFNQLIPRELERLEAVLHELLSFARSSRPHFTKTKVEEVMNNILVLVENEAVKNNVKIIRKYSNTPLTVVDPEQLKQVFMNIILNAIQAMPEGGNLTISTQLKGESEKLKVIEISINDTGSGIPEEHISHLFSPFFSTKEDGTGLGLSISQKIIKDHDGAIEVRSEKGKGTTFLIKLPFKV